MNPIFDLSRTPVSHLQTPETQTPVETQPKDTAVLAPRAGRPAPIPWDQVDWSKPRTAIARELGVALSQVSREARRRGLPMKDYVRKRIDYSNVGWSKSTSDIAKELGTSSGAVSTARWKFAPHTRQRHYKARVPKALKTHKCGSVAFDVRDLAVDIESVSLTRQFVAAVEAVGGGPQILQMSVQDAIRTLVPNGLALRLHPEPDTLSKRIEALLSAGVPEKFRI